MGNIENCISHEKKSSGSLVKRFLPSLSDLRAFEAAARHLSFTRAADELGVTQSAVSRNISKLEQFLSTALFDRSGTRLVLTELGASYYSEIPQLLERLEEVSIDVVRGRRAKASLRIGTSTSMAARLLVPRISSFLSAHEDIHVDIRTIADHGHFNQDEIDVALVRGLGQWPECRAGFMFRERLHVVCAPEFATDGLDRAHFDFNQLPALQNSSRPSLWMSWLRLSGLAHSGAIRGQRFENSEMLIAGVLSGLGFAVIPEHYVADDLAHGRLVAPFGDPVESEESYWLVVPDRKWHDPRTKTFRQWALTRRHLLTGAGGMGQRSGPHTRTVSIES